MSTTADTMDGAGAGGGARRGATPVIVAVVVVIALLAAAGAFVLLRGGSDGDIVALEPATSAGADPFTATVAVGEPADFPQTVVARTAEVRDTLEPDAATGTLVATGTTPGLYGGTRDDASCDVEALAAFLAEDEAKAGAWAGVLDIGTADIPGYLAGLVPVVLTTDTLVTNHGFADGVATPRQAVLQAGTAVMVDDRGTPRVRCSCGNPLTPAAERDLAASELEGEQWSGFETAAVAVVSPGDAATSLTLTDLRTGEPFEAPVGSVDATWIAAAGEAYGSSPGEPTGAILTSPDGVEWSTALTTTPMRGVATSADLAVVVGDDGRGAGAIHTSPDGASWSAPIDVVDPLAAVAHGDGVWIAVGDRSFAEEGGAGDGSAGAIYRSTDATTWERVATTSPYDNPELTAGEESGFLNQTMVSVAHGGDLWVATARECAERVCRAVEFTSPDGTTWTRKLLDASLTKVGVAHDGTRYGLVGAQVDAAADYQGVGGPPAPFGVAGTSSDATTWTFGPTEPDRVLLEGLSAGPGGWLAVDDTSFAQQPGQVADGVHRSTDLLTWERLSTVDHDLHGVAVLRVAFAAPAAAAPTTTTTAAVVTTDAAGLRILTRGLQFMDADGMFGQLALYAEPASGAIATLTAMLGAPTTEFEAGDGTCVAESTVSRWGALRIVVPGKDPAATDWTVVLRGTAAELPAATVEVAGGFTLGTPAAEVASYFPGVPKRSDVFEGSTYDSFLLDPSGGEMDPGTLLFATDGVTDSISAPTYLDDMC